MLRRKGGSGKLRFREAPLKLVTRLQVDVAEGAGFEGGGES